MPDMTSIPDFARWINPLLRALSELGGTARPSEVVDLVARNEAVPDDVLNIVLPSGIQKRFTNQVHWARFYLAHQGYIDRSKQGVWKLTELGEKAGSLSDENISRLVETVQREARNSRDRTVGTQVAPQKTAETPGLISPEEVSALAPEPEQQDYRVRLLRTLQELSPQGFERLSQRLLREAGFEQVVVTGKSGDGGIDGHGILAINSFVTFRVLFQCKRYVGSVSPSHVRDFRGAMAGRADKGLILTTGTFSADARREAIRDGAAPIELVDGEKLVDLFAQFELGLAPVTTYELKEAFFEEYR